MQQGIHCLSENIFNKISHKSAIAYDHKVIIWVYEDERKLEVQKTSSKVMIKCQASVTIEKIKPITGWPG